MKPFFSVVIPTFNRANLIRETIQSVLDQKFEDFEIVVVDDGSEDQTEEVINKLTDPRINLIKQKNRGSGAARNTGIDAARGAYIAFLDSDDGFLPQKLSTMHKSIIHSNADALYSSIIVDRGKGVISLKPRRGIKAGERVDEYLFCARETISTSTIVVKTEIARQVRFFEALDKGDDLVFAVRLYWSGVRFEFVPEPLSIWNDKTSVGRRSHQGEGGGLRQWLDRNRNRLSKRAYYGFGATIVSYEIAYKRPFLSLWLLLRAASTRSISVPVALQCTLRAFLPRVFYRSLVDTVIKSLGSKNMIKFENK